MKVLSNTDAIIAQFQSLTKEDQSKVLSVLEHYRENQTDDMRLKISIDYGRVSSYRFLEVVNYFK